MDPVKYSGSFDVVTSNSVKIKLSLETKTYTDHLCYQYQLKTVNCKLNLTTYYIFNRLQPSLMTT